MVSDILPTGYITRLSLDSGDKPEKLIQPTIGVLKPQNILPELSIHIPA
jgi:hypothetical protein